MFLFSVAPNVKINGLTIQKSNLMSSSPLQTSLIAQAADEPGLAAYGAEEPRNAWFDESCNGNEKMFHSFAMETSAVYGEHAESFAQSLV